MHALMPSSTTIVLVASAEQRRNSLAQQLEALGYSVIGIADGRALMDVLKLSRYDLVVVDLVNLSHAASQELTEQVADLLARGTPILMLTSDQHATPETWTQETLGYRITAALRNRNADDVLSERASRWEGLGVLDPETLLFSRRYFDAIFALELERSKRGHQPAALLLIDLSAAPLTPALWRTVSVRLLTSLRQTDLLVRYSTETVLVLLPITEAALARAVATRLLKTLREIKVDPEQPLQIHIGIAAYPAHGTTPETLLSAARHALGRAAATGTIISFEQL